MTELEHEVVISGIGGKFPQADNVLQLQEKLFSKEDLITNEMRWTPDTVGVGKVNDVDTFDGYAFKMHSKLVRATDPTTTQTLERAFESIIDAGMNPFAMSGRKIAVISASMVSDAENTRSFTDDTLEFSMMGHSRTMMANRISYTFNFTGPSYSIHSSWAGGVTALQQGAALIAQGHAEAAVVTTAVLIFFRATTIEYEHMNLLTPGGRCRSFDADANGTCRSEGVVSFFLQRASEAKRNYATLIGIQSECLGPRNCSLPQFDKLLEETIRKFYEKTKIDPEKVAYLEVDGSGIKKIDTLEINALSSVLFEKRKSPLLVGSVKSNLGNTEASSSLVGITKCIIAMETGMIPPNIHYSNPNPDISALVNGIFQPVTEATELKGDLVSLNALSLGGTVGHVVIKRNAKVKKPLAKGELPPDGLHRLIFLSARHEEGAKINVEKLQQMPVDIEYASMVNDVFKTSISGYLWKSYVVVPTNEVKYNIKKSDSNIKLPIWYVFSGMGSQWAGMGRDLLQIPIFSAAVDRCDAVLRPRGLDIRHILTTSEKSTFDNILNCFVGIAAVQIGLVDILRAVGLEPDGIVGHSVGELGCAYADGCFTAEEMVLAAYARGKASLDVQVIQGMMAAIGLGYKEMCTRVPPTVDIACHNAADSCTLSGPTDDVISYVEELKDQGVFAKAVSAGNIAYHSRYIKPIAPKLLQYLSEVIKEPKRRSAKWISSSVPEADWASPEAQLSSAEYHTNNLLSPVLFEEACVHIPDNAIVIEIAPHGLLQAILRRSLNKGCVNVPLTNRQSGDSVQFLLDALGSLYLNNVSLDINAIYPPIEYPVSRGTPYISPLVTWDHNERWFQDFRSTLEFSCQHSSAVEVKLDESAEDYALWSEHKVEDQIVLSPAQILVYVWELFLDANAQEFEKEAIHIEEVKMSNQVVFQHTPQQLLIAIMKGNNNFEVCHGVKEEYGETFLTGKIKQITSPSLDAPVENNKAVEQSVDVTADEVLNILSQLGYQFGNQFQLIRQIHVKNKGATAVLVWKGNMVTFLDAIFKLIIFLEMEEEHKFLYPSSFLTLTVDTPKFFKLQKGAEVEVHYDSRTKVLECNGLKLVGLTLSPDPSVRKETTELYWKKRCFIPFNTEQSKLNEFMSLGLQIVAEESLNKWRQKVTQISIVVLKDTTGMLAILNDPLNEAIASLPNVVIKSQEVDISQAKDIMSGSFRSGESWLVIGAFGSLQQLLGSLPSSGFLLAYVHDAQTSVNHQTLLKPILVHHGKSGGKVVLLKKRTEVHTLKIVEVKNEAWLSEVASLCRDSNDKPVAVVTHNMKPLDILPVLSKQKFAHQVRCLFLEKSSPKFSAQHPLYQNQLSLGLAVGVLSQGVWGTECVLPIAADSLSDPSKGVIISSDSNLDLNVVALNTSSLTYFPGRSSKKEAEEVKCVDYCGTRSRGEKVMGVAQFDSQTNTVTPDPTLWWPVPPQWSMDDASTVPVAFTLAYYALCERAMLKAKEKILIHMGSSPAGQAFIAVALQVGADVYVTIDNQDHLQPLLWRFPQLQTDKVLALERFDLKVRMCTKNEGVDVLVNCLQGYQTSLSMNLLGSHSRFIHLSEIDIRNGEIVGMSIFIRNAHFYGISLSNIINTDIDTKRRLSILLKDGLENGVVKPLKKRVFSLRNFNQANTHLHERCFDEKTLVIIKPEGRSELSTDSPLGFQCQPQSTYIIVGCGGELWLDLAEWLVGRGARWLILAPTSAHLNSSQAHRLDHLVKLNYARLTTYDDVSSVLDQAARAGPVGGIFIVGLPENSPVIAHVDDVARRLAPKLPHFVCLLGGGTDICQSRVQLGFSSLHIQSEKPLSRPKSVLPYLSAVLTGTDSTSFSYLVTDQVANLSNINESYMVDEDPYNYLPSSLDDLLALGEDVSSVPCLREVPTRTPPHSNIKYNVLPLFILPGISASNLGPFISHLMYPAYCAPLTDASLSIDSLAEALQQEILQVQNRGPYNIVGETWSGALALQLATLLESNGHTVELFLLEGAPAVAQHWVRALADEHSVGITLLANLLSLENKVLKQIKELISWERQLEVALKFVQVDANEEVDSVKVRLAKSLTALRNRLNTVIDYKPQLFKGNIHLIRPKGASDANFCELQMSCQKKPIVHLLDWENHNEAIKSKTYAKIVNENVLFTWDL